MGRGGPLPRRTFGSMCSAQSLCRLMSGDALKQRMTKPPVLSETWSATLARRKGFKYTGLWRRHSALPLLLAGAEGGQEAARQHPRRGGWRLGQPALPDSLHDCLSPITP